jgi:hypothetical protein
MRADPELRATTKDYLESFVNERPIIVALLLFFVLRQTEAPLGKIIICCLAAFLLVAMGIGRRPIDALVGVSFLAMVIYWMHVPLVDSAVAKLIAALS